MNGLLLVLTLGQLHSDMQTDFVILAILQVSLFFLLCVLIGSNKR